VNNTTVRKYPIQFPVFFPTHTVLSLSPQPFTSHHFTTHINFSHKSPFYPLPYTALSGYSACQEITWFLWNPEVHYRVHESLPLVPLLRHINLVHASLSYFSKIRFNIIVACTRRVSPPKLYVAVEMFLCGIRKLLWTCLLLSLLFSWYNVCTVIYIHIYTGCNRRNGPDFGRAFLMLNYTEKPQNTYIQSWTVWEIMASEVWNFDICYTLTDYQIRIETGRNMWFL